MTTRSHTHARTSRSPDIDQVLALAMSLGIAALLVLVLLLVVDGKPLHPLGTRQQHLAQRGAKLEAGGTRLGVLPELPDDFAVLFCLACVLRSCKGMGQVGEQRV